VPQFEQRSCACGGVSVWLGLGCFDDFLPIFLRFTAARSEQPL
jgi:hypothetical protein